jgi:hypothetical protein
VQYTVDCPAHYAGSPLGSQRRHAASTRLARRIERLGALGWPLPLACCHACLDVAVDPVLIVWLASEHHELWALEHLALTARHTAR